MSDPQAREPLLVLIASPLLGPSSWGPLADALAARGRASLTSVDEPDRPGEVPYWQSTVAGVVRSLREAPLDRLPAGRPIVLVGHSGAGALLPAVAAALTAAIEQPVVASVLMDAGLPAPGRSRLETMVDEAPSGAAFATTLAATLDAGGRHPEWTDADLSSAIPDPDRRRLVLAELRPRGRDYWREPLPPVSPAPGARLAYLWFSASYVTAAERARALGWPVRHLPAGHFHHLVDEDAVADALLELLSA